MSPRTKRRLKRIGWALAGLYVAGGIALYFFQDRLLFHPLPLARDHAFQFDDPFEEVNLPVGKDNLSLLKFPTAEEKRGIVLYFHGNMDNVERYRDAPFLFTRSGYEVWMMDYPGFGKTTGARTENRILSDALRLYELASREVHPDSIVLYGRSLGTGVAAALAAGHPCHQLILESPYWSIRALARHYFPPYGIIPLNRYSFPTCDYLRSVTCPVTILHGTDDEVVPFSQGRRLSRIGKQTGFIPIAGGHHNDLYGREEFQVAIDSVLSN